MDDIRVHARRFAVSNSRVSQGSSIAARSQLYSLATRYAVGGPGFKMQCDSSADFVEHLF
jgi:hypothetical protein